MADRPPSQYARPHGLAGRAIGRAMAVWNAPMYRQVAAALALGPDDALLEIGCGAGLFLARHAAGVRRVAAVDASPDMIALARRRLRRRVAEGSADLRVGDGTRLPWPAASFSAVCLVEVVYFVADLPALFAGARRVLRPGGRLVLSSEWTRDEGRDRERAAARYGMRLRSADELEADLRGAGFERVERRQGRGWWSGAALVLRAWAP